MFSKGFFLRIITSLGCVVEDQTRKQILDLSIMETVEHNNSNVLPKMKLVFKQTSKKPYFTLTHYQAQIFRLVQLKAFADYKINAT